MRLPPCVREAGRSRTPLHRRPDLPRPGGRAAAAFRQPGRLRYRGPRGEGGRGLLHRRLDPRARRHLHARDPPRRRTSARRERWGEKSAREPLRRHRRRRRSGSTGWSRPRHPPRRRDRGAALARHYGSSPIARRDGSCPRPEGEEWDELNDIDGIGEPWPSRSSTSSRSPPTATSSRASPRARRRGHRRPFRRRLPGLRQDRGFHRHAEAMTREEAKSRAEAWAPRSRARSRPRPTTSSPARAPARSRRPPEVASP